MGGPQVLADLHSLAGRYDFFLIDQFGVLHDGTVAYQGAAEALSSLKAMGKKIVLVSNSGKRARQNEDRLRKLGFEGSWDVFLSSGEVAWRKFAGQLGGERLAPGTRCLLLSRGNDRSAIDGLGLDLVTEGAKAEIILLSGSEGDSKPLEFYRALLEPAARAGVPCICTNPDKIMLTEAGLRFGAGAIADLYEEMGGPVERIGKPFGAIYEAAMEVLGHPAKDRVVGIGDSIEHDIAGANNAGISSVLVRSGILAELGPAELEKAFAQHGATPDFVLPQFIWMAGA
ncbi:MAG TPA: TIGR01459 family HAD-type hydrolase [Mesorhizobium sp.]